jgi:hypothetical protein
VNTLNTRSLPAGNDALEARFALRVAARLNERAEDVGADLSERLRISREQALLRARSARAATAPEAKVGITAAGAALLGGRWWIKLGSVVPLVALLVGLVWIQQVHMDEQISVAAEIDAALLADDVPPKAYSDPGFVEFLKTPRD